MSLHSAIWQGAFEGEHCTCVCRQPRRHEDLNTMEDLDAIEGLDTTGALGSHDGRAPVRLLAALQCIFFVGYQCI